MTNVVDIFEDIKPLLVQQIAQTMQTKLPMYQKMELDYIEQQVEVSLNALEKDIIDHTEVSYQQFWQKISHIRAEQHTPIEAVLTVLRINSTTIIAVVKQHLTGHLLSLIGFLEALHMLTESAIAGIYAGYAQYQESVIEEQLHTLQELSTPIIPIHEGILIVPLIGTINPQRAMNMMEVLLEGINEHAADVIILDITGVPVLDTGVANHLIQISRAVRLLGSQIVLVGIGPEIAQTIVQLGIDLQSITTHANLQAGVRYALGLQHLLITSVE